MKNIKKISKVVLLVILFFSTRQIVLADNSVNIILKIYADDTVIFNGPETVTACAESPAPDAPITINGKCAIEQVVPALSNTWTWNYAPSGWLNELSGYTTTPDFSKFWSWFNNLSLGGTGLNQHSLSSGEELLLTYNSYPLRISASKSSGIIGDTITFTAEEESTFDANYNMLWTPSSEATITLGTQTCTTATDGTCFIVLNTAGSLNAIGSKTLRVPSNNVNIQISTPPAETRGGSGSIPINEPSSTPISQEIIPITVEKTKFDLKKAFDFLITQQEKNGSFGQDIYTDWATLAFASSNYQDQTIKLVRYAVENKTEGMSLTDNERHAMALLSLGLNPYNTNNENYIEKIITSFDGKQFGDANEDNDDIFALIVLQSSGYTQDEKMINDDISFILSRQKENGSFDESVDMTGAAIEALSPFSPTPLIGESLEKAKNFLREKQKENGGWGNASSTAWALEGITALGEKPEDWKRGDNTPLDYLATIQDIDGGIKNENINTKIWETAYVSSILSSKTWNQIMQKFEKPKIQEITKVQKKFVKKQKNTPIIITTPINTEKIPPPTTKVEPSQESWFVRLLTNIFNL
ncbi:MAG: prenyltransferase/squalene oxidase repeat-containing protein [Candidatus Paceibacterota bacterium]|jgi:hypothetical protein